jgi:hypothetical protein
MELVLKTPLFLLIGALFSLVGLVLAVKLLPLSPSEPSQKVSLRGRLHQALLILAIAGSGMALPLLGVAWARLSTMPLQRYTWGLVGLGILQSALGVLIFAARGPDEGTPPRMSNVFRRWGLPAFVLVAGLAWIAIGLVAAVAPSRSAAAPAAAIEPDREEVQRSIERVRPMDEDDGRQTLIGVVRDGEFWVLAPADSAGLPARLTRIAMQESVAPQSREIDLREYEGSAILVRGRDGGGWVYEAEVIDQGGPLLAEIAEQVFRPETRY